MTLLLFLAGKNKSYANNEAEQTRSSISKYFRFTYCP